MQITRRWCGAGVSNGRLANWGRPCLTLPILVVSHSCSQETDPCALAHLVRSGVGIRCDVACGEARACCGAARRGGASRGAVGRVLKAREAYSQDLQCQWQCVFLANMHAGVPSSVKKWGNMYHRPLRLGDQNRLVCSIGRYCPYTIARFS